MVQKPLVLVAPLEFLTPQWDRDAMKRRGELITKSTSRSLMVKPATPRDWKGMVSQHEIKALLSEVFINGVQEEFRHVLNSEMARYGELTEEQMYNAVKRHEVYLGRTKCLRGGATAPATPQKGTPL